MEASVVSPRPSATRRRSRLWLWALLVLLAVLVVFPILCSVWVWFSTRNRVYTNTREVPFRKVGVVLGTSAKVGKWDNAHFVNRMEAAAALYHAGRVRHLIVSGDNLHKNYNEPAAMYAKLIQLKVPHSAITLDYAGLRSLDTIVRAQKVFGITSFTIISDDFHVPRCLFLARAYGDDCVALAADPVPWSSSARSRMREWLARFVAVLDLYLWNKQPMYLGKRVPLPDLAGET